MPEVNENGETIIRLGKNFDTILFIVTIIIFFILFAWMVMRVRH